MSTFARVTDFRSILFLSLPDSQIEQRRETPDFFHDLNLDQIVQAITAGRQDYDLVPFFHAPLKDIDAIAYRQEVMKDLENKPVMQAVVSFCEDMQTMRLYIDRTKKSYYKYEKEPWVLAATEIYCAALQRLAQNLNRNPINSQGLHHFHAYLTEYVASDFFTKLASETRKLRADLSAIRYCLVIRNGSVTVRGYEGEIDYSAAVEETFEKFRRGPGKDYRAKLSDRPGMNHIQAQIVEGVARLNPAVFQVLQSFCANDANYADEIIIRFDREIQFYVAYLAYIEKFRRAGLNFCYPELSRTSKELDSRGSFDLALAGKCIDTKASIVCNDFSMRGPERVFVISGPNQGGKTTFARTFGQLHYLAGLGCPVPGTQARLFHYDLMFTHFDREEDITNLRGKLQDDLVRIRHILDHATPNSIIIMNELFQSTTLHDAVYLSKKIMAQLVQLDLLGAWVTFLTELATFSDQTVSLVSAVDPHDPAIRTFKVERQPAEGVAYALTVAEKYRVTYDQIKARIKEAQA